MTFPSRSPEAGSRSRWFIRNSWHFEHTRHSLSFQYSGDELKAIRKGSVLFQLKESDERIYIGSDARIEQTAEGYRWEDKTGRWKRFDQQGRLMAYGDRDGVTGKLIYGSENATIPEGIADRTGEQVIWYEHSGVKVFAVRDSSGRRVEYTYSQDKLSKITGVLGKETTYEYDDQGRIISKTDAAGRRIQITYTDKGKVASVKDEEGKGHRFDYGYNEADEQYYTLIEAPSGRVKEVWYDLEGRPERVDINGDTEKVIEHDQNDLLITNGQGREIRKEYNEWDKLTKVTYPDGTSLDISYDNQLHKPVRINDRKGCLTLLEYDQNGNLIRKEEASGSSAERIITYTYNGLGRPVSATVQPDKDTAKAETLFSYDHRGNLVSMTDPTGKYSPLSQSRSHGQSRDHGGCSGSYMGVGT